MPRTEIIKLVEEYDRVLDTNCAEAIRRFLQKHPGVQNYDGRGNWVGPISNENGWAE